MSKFSMISSKEFFIGSGELTKLISYLNKHNYSKYLLLSSIYHKDQINQLSLLFEQEGKKLLLINDPSYRADSFSLRSCYNIGNKAFIDGVVVLGGEELLSLGRGLHKEFQKNFNKAIDYIEILTEPYSSILFKNFYYLEDLHFRDLRIYNFDIPKDSIGLIDPQLMGSTEANKQDFIIFDLLLRIWSIAFFQDYKGLPKSLLTWGLNEVHNKGVFPLIKDIDDFEDLSALGLLISQLESSYKANVFWYLTKVLAFETKQSYHLISSILLPFFLDYFSNKYAAYYQMLISSIDSSLLVSSDYIGSIRRYYGKKGFVSQLRQIGISQKDLSGIAYKTLSLMDKGDSLNFDIDEILIVLKNSW